MRQVQLHDAEQQFAALVSEAEAGGSMTILRGDRPVAQIIPFPESVDRETARLQAVAQLNALMEKGVDMGLAWNGRDELYDRD